MSKSNWNQMATWYDTMVGSSGHKYHQAYAIPTVLKLLNLKKGDKVLDIGCGSGALASYTKKVGANYYGVDVSKNLIGAAVKRHQKEGKFYVGSASTLSDITELSGMKFDGIVFMLSIQDMDPLQKIISEAAAKLKEDGKMVIFMLHPSFRIPRQSGWGEDKHRKIIFRRVDRYMSEKTIPLNTNIRHNGKRITSYVYHRPLQSYFKAFKANGLAVRNLIEIAESKKGYDEFPTFLGMQIVKL